MLVFKFFLLFLALAISVCPSLSTPTPAGELASYLGPKCTNVVIPVSITAKNADLHAVTALLDLFELVPIDFTLVSLFNLVARLVNLPFSSLSRGTYNIAGTYCEPEVYIESRRNTIQFLAHPATYDHTYWFGGLHSGVDGTRYSWVSYASKLGYPTFSFDRLGNGGSDHPNSITTVQCPAQAATVHELVKLARAGASPFPRKFCNFIFVGESLGSIVGNFVNVEYPHDFNSTILGGFSKFWANAVPGFTATADLLPAFLTDRAKYGFLNGDLGYLIANSLPGIEYLLFYGPGQYYDPNFIALDYAARGTITIGEAITGALGISVAEDYTGSVLVLTGNQDVVFCGTFDLPVDGPGDCDGTGILAKTQDLYPKARPYSWFSLDNSGHCWQHQYTAQTGFKYAHDWLAAQGF